MAVNVSTGLDGESLASQAAASCTIDAFCTRLLPMLRSPVKLFPEDVRMTLPSFQVTRTWRPGGFALPPHTHEHTNVALCVAGSYDESLAEGWLRVTPATLICRPGGVTHANNYERGASRALIFEVPQATLRVISPFSRVLDRPLHLESATVAALARRADGQIALEDDVSPLELEAIAFELIALATRHEATERDAGAGWLPRVKQFIEAEFRRTLRLDELARIGGVHPAHLARAFRAQFGRSVGAFVRERRVAHAATLLRRHSLSLAEISAEAGFYDQSHFTRVFTRQMGISPARFRRSLRT
jgi:AraC family transcriptional regulator